MTRRGGERPQRVQRRSASGAGYAALLKAFFSVSLCVCGSLQAGGAGAQTASGIMPPAARRATQHTDTAPDKPDASAALLTLRPLRDAGGLEHGLNTRLTAALARFLSDHAKSAFCVTSASANAAQTGTPRYTLEGELSCANGQGEERARYLLVTRLYREAMDWKEAERQDAGRKDVDWEGMKRNGARWAKPRIGQNPKQVRGQGTGANARAERALVGQWAGTSDSLRLLTTNLRHDPRFHTLGLVGELGGRIVTVIADDRQRPATRWRALLPHTLAAIPSVAIITEEEPTQAARRVPLAAPFRLRVTRADAMPTHLLALDAYDTLTAIAVVPTRNAPRVEDGRTLVSRPLLLPEGVAAVWAVYRITPPPSAKGSPPRRAAFAPLPPVAEASLAALIRPSAFRTPAHIGTRCGSCLSGPQRATSPDDAPVQTLDGIGNTVPPPVEGGLAYLLDDIARDPSAWRVTYLPVEGRD